MEKELVSIVIPVYNGEIFIERCIKSVLNQEYNNLEIIIVDDGSIDGTALICKKYVSLDNRIKYYKKENGGVSKARNFGIYKSTGKYIIFVDADDELYFDCINKMYLNIKNTNADIIIGSYYSYRRTKIKKKQIYDFCIMNQSDFVDNFDQIISMIVTPWGKLYKSEIIKDNNIYFNEKMSIGEDNCFNIRYFFKCNNICTINEVVYKYYLGGNATTQIYHENINKMYKTLFIEYKVLFGENIDLLKRLASDLYEAIIDHYIFFCKKNTAIKKLEETFELFTDEKKYLDIKLNKNETYAVLDKNFSDFYKLYYKRKYFYFIKRRIANQFRKVIRF